MKLPAHRAELPGDAISFYIVPPDPAHSAGLAGHLAGHIRIVGFIIPNEPILSISKKRL